MPETAAPRQLEDAPEPPRLRALWRMVMALTATLILGIVTVVVLLVIRLAALDSAPAPTLPEAIALPAGERAGAVTFGVGWIALVTTDEAGIERIRVHDATTGAALAETVIPAR